MAKLMTFIQIFREDGIYTCKAWAGSGVCIEIKKSTLTIKVFKKPTDITSRVIDLNNGALTVKLVHNLFKRVSTVAQLFHPFETI